MTNKNIRDGFSLHPDSGTLLLLLHISASNIHTVFAIHIYISLMLHTFEIYEKECS